MNRIILFLLLTTVVFGQIKVSQLPKADALKQSDVIMISQDSSGVLKSKRILARDFIKEVHPEDFSGTDAQKLQTALDSAAFYNKPLVLKNNALYTVNVQIASNTSNNVVIKGNGAKIKSTLFSAGVYGDPLGAIHISNSKSVTIENLEIEATNLGLSPATNYLCGLVLESVDDVVLQTVKVSKAPYFGVWLWDVDRFSITDGYFTGSLYGNIGLTACKNGEISGNYISLSGYTPPVYGYGISLTHQMGTGVNNENIEIHGNTVVKNKRKGIDVHGGVNINIHDNFVSGFASSGIYAVNEGGNAQYHNKLVKDITISHNVIEQDAEWFASLTFTGDPYNAGIQIGSYGNVNGDNNPSGEWYGGGIGNTFTVFDNTLRNLDAIKSGTNYCKYGIHSFASMTNLIQIVGNKAKKFTCEDFIYVGSGNDIAGFQPQLVDISNNKTDSVTATILLHVVAGKKLVISNNNFVNSASTYGVVVGNYLAGSSIQSLNLFRNSFTDQVTTKYSIGDIADVYRDDYLVMGYSAGVKAGIGQLETTGFTPEYAWDIDGNIRARYDMIVGSDVADGRTFLMKADGTQGVALRANDISEFANSISVTGDINVTGVYKKGGTQIGTDDLVDFPSQTGNSGKFLTTNGSVLSWGTPSVAWGNITGTLASQTDLKNALDAKLDLSGGSLTGGLSTIGNITLTATDNLIQNTTADLDFRSAGGFNFGYSQTQYLNVRYSIIPCLLI